MNGRLYFDHAATTPARPEAVEAMLPHLAAGGFNPSSLHAEGRAARAALDAARATVARVLGAAPREIVFTGGGSEADNLAILGAARAARAATGRAHVVTGATEHHAVLHAMDVLRDEGFAVSVLPVDGDGRIAPEEFAAALGPQTAVASLMLANNEVGTVHPVAAFARAARARGVVFHTDAVQAPGRTALDVAALGVDLLTVSAHKFYGPKGIGVLYVRSGTPLRALVVGGGQEAGLRAGTENVAGAAGLARALELAEAERPAETARLVALRARLEGAVAATVPGSRVNAARAERLPNIASIAFEGADATTMLARLDLAGAAVSAGSACAAGAAEPSHVLAALGEPAWVGTSTLRFSLGKLTSEEDVERLVQMLPEVVAAARDAAPEMGTYRPGASYSYRAEVRS